MITDILDWTSWFTGAVVLILLVALIHGKKRPEWLFLGALVALLLGGAISPLESISGFGNYAVLTVGALFIVAAGVQKSKLLTLLEPLLMPVKGSIRSTLFRLMGSTSVLSSVLNNTPIVAMLTPQLEEWSKKSGVPLSRLLIPLSYAAIVGGTVTLIGTSTNLIVSGMLMDRGLAPFHLFQLAWIGLPATLLVIAWFALIGYRYLPDRGQNGENLTRNELARARKIYNRPYTVHFPKEQRDYLPGVVGATGFRSHEAIAPAYGASVLFSAYSTGFAPLPSGVYSTVKTENRDHRFDLFFEQGVPALLILGFMLVSSVFGFLPVHISVIFSAIAMIVSGVLPMRDVFSTFQYPVLIVIGSALGIGAAIENTGLAAIVANQTISFASGYGVIAVLVMMYIMTNLLTELITNNAAAVLMIPIVFGASQSLGIDPHAAGMIVAVAASASFLSPIGYQTNLMVMKPGGYRFTDFTKAGLPVSLILMIVTVAVVYGLYI